jgi:hypothetical protein
MSEFFKKNKKVLIIILGVFLLLALGAGVYFFILDGELSGLPGTDKTNQEENMDDMGGDENVPEEIDESVTPMPDYDERSSKEAIDATYIAAKEWSEDVELYKCQGLPTSVQFPDITYEYIGAEGGKYYRWMCTYYSKDKAQTKIFAYVGGEFDESTEALDIGEFGDLLYDSIEYPTDIDGIVESTVVYANALENGLDEENYANIYLGDAGDYGYVWKIEERSKTEKDEYEIGVLQNIYIYDIYTGELVDKTQEEVF